jgi:methylated-DNA-[protein]-cysteine S-methyltransferase
MICYTEYASPLSTLLLAASDKGLCGLYFEQHKYFDGPQDWLRSNDHPMLREAKQQLDEYFAGKRERFTLALDLPFGATGTYTAIAQRVGRVAAVRATGTAIGRNPVSIIVPCHRVLGASGALSGYAGGLERKQYLLALEEAVAGGRKNRQELRAG